MNKKKLILTLLCALGSGMVGFFANQLTEVYGIILFSFGMGMMVCAIMKLNKSE